MSLELELQDAQGAPEISLTGHLSGREKAAIAVRLLLQSGTVAALADLPEALQTALTLQLVRMAPVDQITVDAVAVEFADAIEAIGFCFQPALTVRLVCSKGRSATALRTVFAGCRRITFPATLGKQFPRSKMNVWFRSLRRNRS